MILGCSHAQGAEMWLDAAYVSNGYPDEDFGLKNSYPALIGQELGYEIYNYSMGGGCNDAIFRIARELLPTLTNDDLVIACWTGGDRSEIWHGKHNIWLQISPGTTTYLRREIDDVHLSGRTIDIVVDDCDQYVEFTKKWTIFAINDQSSRNNKIKNIIALNDMLTSAGIPAINLDSFDPVDDPALENFFWPEKTNFMEFCNANKFPRTHYGHYFFEAHRAYAHKVLENIHG